MHKYDICDANKLSLGLLKFSNIRKTNTIYVDKTNVIAKIAKKECLFFSCVLEALEKRFL